MDAKNEFIATLALQLEEWRKLRKNGVGVRLFTVQTKNGKRTFLIAAFALRGHNIAADEMKIYIDGEDIENLLPEAMTGN